MGIVSAAVCDLPSVNRTDEAAFDGQVHIGRYSQRTYAFAEVFGHAGDIGGDGARFAVVK